MSNNFDSKDLIDGICSDSRIGQDTTIHHLDLEDYCLPKDTKQLDQALILSQTRLLNH